MNENLDNYYVMARATEEKLQQRWRTKWRGPTGNEKKCQKRHGGNDKRDDTVN